MKSRIQSKQSSSYKKINAFIQNNHTKKKRSLSHFIFSSFAYKAAAFCGCSNSTGEAVRRGSCSSGFIGNKWHCAYCAINWSTRTKATIASTIGTAAATIQKNPKSKSWVIQDNTMVSVLYIVTSWNNARIVTSTRNHLSFFLISGYSILLPLYNMEGERQSMCWLMITKQTFCYIYHELTPIVDVGLKATLMFIISPFDIPPYA